MEKLDKVFQPKEVLKSEDLNTMVGKTNELVDAVGDGGVFDYDENTDYISGSVVKKDNELFFVYKETLSQNITPLKSEPLPDLNGDNKVDMVDEKAFRNIVNRGSCKEYGLKINTWYSVGDFGLFVMYKNKLTEVTHTNIELSIKSLNERIAALEPATPSLIAKLTTTTDGQQVGVLGVDAKDDIISLKIDGEEALELVYDDEDEILFVDIQVAGEHTFEYTFVDAAKIPDWACLALNFTSIEISDRVAQIGDHAFENCKKVSSIKIHSKTAPVIAHASFGTGTSTCGYSNRNKGINMLYVPSDATGYNGWGDALFSSYANFVISYTL